MLTDYSGTVRNRNAETFGNCYRCVQTVNYRHCSEPLRLMTPADDTVRVRETVHIYGDPRAQAPWMHIYRELFSSDLPYLLRIADLPFSNLILPISPLHVGQTMLLKTSSNNPRINQLFFQNGMELALWVSKYLCCEKFSKWDRYLSISHHYFSLLLRFILTPQHKSGK